MRSRFKLVFAILLFIFSGSMANASVKRIANIAFDKEKVERIYMSPGLATAILFPCEIDEALPGRTEDLKVVVSPTSKKQLSLFLTNASALSTNLLVRCGDKRDLFVFEIIANRATHQDVVKVDSVGRSYENGEDSVNLVKTSSRTRKSSNLHVVDVQKPILLRKSE